MAAKTKIQQRRYKKYKLVDNSKELDNYITFQESILKEVQKIKTAIPIIEAKTTWDNLNNLNKLNSACNKVDYNDEDQLKKAMFLTKMSKERAEIHKNLSKIPDTLNQVSVTINRDVEESYNSIKELQSLINGNKNKSVKNLSIQTESESQTES